jgi:branched-chain amino acid transport system permease protein
MSRRALPLPLSPRVLAVLGLALAALVAVPLVVDSSYALHLCIVLFSATALGLAWNVIGGFGGQYSVGHAAYFGLGAYAAMILFTKLHIPPWYGAFLGMGLSVAVAWVIGSITFRLRGPYFVLASIAVAEILRLTALNWKPLTNAAEGILMGDVPALVVGPLRIEFDSKTPYYYIGLFLVVAGLLVNWQVKRSRLGYWLQAIREDQDAAWSLGIPPTRIKNAGLMISAALTALVGCYTAMYTGFIDPPGVLDLGISVQIVLTCIIGGIGTVAGPVVGAVLLTLLSEALRANLLAAALFGLGVPESSAFGHFLRENLAHAHVLVYGLLVVVVILFMPEGVLGFVEKRLRARQVRALAKLAPPEPLAQERS